MKPPINWNSLNQSDRLAKGVLSGHSPSIYHYIEDLYRNQNVLMNIAPQTLCFGDIKCRKVGRGSLFRFNISGKKGRTMEIKVDLYSGVV